MELKSPYSEQAERAVIGSMLMSEEAVLMGVAALTQDDFYLRNNRIIYNAISNVYHNKIAVDITTVTDELVNMMELDTVGGVPALVSITDEVISTNIDYYITILRDKKNLRDLLNYFNTTVEGFSETAISNVAEYMANIEKNILTITRDSQVGGFQKSKDIVSVIQEQFSNAKAKTGGNYSGISSGFKELDDKTDGWQKGNLIILAARPSMGKSALALNFATNAAKINKVPVAIFSLEMPAEHLVQRMISSVAHVPLENIRKINFEGDDLVKFESGCKKIAGYPIYIDDTPGAKLIDIQAKARKLKSLRPELGLIMIDYLGLITSGSGTKKQQDNRQQEVADISRALKALAREIDTPIIVLSQLSRQAENRKGEDKRPMLSDLRDSGAIEQDADAVLFIYRDDYYSKDKEEKDKPVVEAELLLSKHRNGPTGIINLMFYKQYTQFESNYKKPEE